MVLNVLIGAGVAVLVILGVGVWLWRRGHHRVGGVMLVLLLIVVLAVGGFPLYLNNKLGNINRADTSALSEGERPGEGDGEAINILLLGADDPDPAVDKESVGDMMASGDWRAGAYRSDTIMVLHIPADRSRAYFVSVPRDSYVPLFEPDGTAEPDNKINAAFSLSGPLSTWRTVENLSQVRLDHMAIIDFTGFRELTTALGGVDVFVPERVVDTMNDQTWDQGWHHIEGELALKYVRMRYGLDEGDFDRVARQQNFMRAVIEKTTASQTLANPLKLTDVLDIATSQLTVDEGWDNGEIRGLAYEMRGLTNADMEFVTLPLDRYDSVDGVGSVNIIDKDRSRELWRAVLDDTLDDYVAAHPEDSLPDPQEVD